MEQCHAVATCSSWSTNLNQKALQVATVKHFNNYRLGTYNIISVYKYIHMYAMMTKSLNLKEFTLSTFQL